MSLFEGLQYAFVYLFGEQIKWVAAFFVASGFMISFSYLWFDLLSRLQKDE